MALTILKTLTKLRRCQQRLDLLSGNRQQNDPRILCGLPEFRVEALPDPVRRMVPAPMKVERELNSSSIPSIFGGPVTAFSSLNLSPLEGVYLHWSNEKQAGPRIGTRLRSLPGFAVAKYPLRL